MLAWGEILICVGGSALKISSARLRDSPFDDGPLPYRFDLCILSEIQHEALLEHIRRVGVPLYTRQSPVTSKRSWEAYAPTINLRLDKHPHPQIVDEVQQGADSIKAVLGKDPLLYRPPGGALSPEVVDVARQRGERVLKWSVDPSDYRKPGAGAIHDRIIGAVHPGAVILMHDGGGDRSQTVDQLRALIRDLKARGFSFATPTD